MIIIIELGLSVMVYPLWIHHKIIDYNLNLTMLIDKFDFRVQRLITEEFNFVAVPSS